VSDEPDDGRNGSPFLAAASAWCFGASLLLLLPRQWVSAGIALGLSLILGGWHLWRSRPKP
jgi:hypothetical protein